MSKILEIQSKLNLSFENLSVKDVLFITGSGISAASPTSFALGEELHELLLKSFSKLSFDEIKLLIDSKFPFEKSCQIIVDSFGTRTIDTGENIGWLLISELFAYGFDKIRSNELHQYFRNHLKKGGVHITANLDQFIEKSRLTINNDFQITTTQSEIKHRTVRTHNLKYEAGLLYKFHGDVNIDNIGEQGFLLRSIEDGFPNNIKLFWSNLISQSRLVIFVGYGGVDKFDVEKYFSQLNMGYFTNTSAIWIDYNDHKDIYIHDSCGNRSAYLDPFYSKIRVSSPANHILNELFDDEFQISNAHRVPNNMNEYIKRLFCANKNRIPDSVVEKITSIHRKHLDA